MQLARFGVFWVLAGAAGCGGHEGASAAGAWTGTMTDNTGTRTLTGNCNQRDGDDLIVVRCVFTVTDAVRGAGEGTLFAHLFTTPGSSSGSLSYALGIVPPPCRVNVSGDAAVTPTAMTGTYGGADDCIDGPVREGRLNLTRP